MKKSLYATRKVLRSKTSAPKVKPVHLSPVQLGRIRTMIGPTLNQADLASMLGISPAHVSLLVRGMRKPSVEIASHMAKILGVPVDRLLNTLAGK